MLDGVAGGWSGYLWSQNTEKVSGTISDAGSRVALIA